MKLFYSILEPNNHWFTTYYTHYKKKLGIAESMYNFYLFYKSGPLAIVEMQTDNTLILIDNNLASNKEEAIKVLKLMIKDRKYLIFV